MKDVMAIIMAGGKGKRLQPLTTDRAKPSVPFGGAYRLIDVTLSNAINSDIYKILVLPQYKSQSLVDHLEAGWNIFSYDLGHYLRIASPQMQSGERWYEGTADSVRQNAYLIERERNLAHVIILSGDHVYKMDYSLFRRYHEQNDADVTISAIEVDVNTAREYGVMEVDERFNIRAFQEKPANPATIPGQDDKALASMGIYIFKAELLREVLAENSGMDFGHDVIPSLMKRCKIMAYPYRAQNRLKDYVQVLDEDGNRKHVLQECAKDSGYWRDVGNLDAYWNANMDLCGTEPYFNLYGRLWPIRTRRPQLPPAKFVFNDRHAAPPRMGMALESLVGQGCVISGSVVRSSVLSPNVMVHSWAQVDESVILGDVEIGRHCRVKKAIIDKQNHLPEGTEIGINPMADRERFSVTERGITVVPKGYFPPR